MNQTALLQAASSVGLFLLLAVPGFLFAKKKWITIDQVGGLSNVMVNYLWPVMVLDAMVKTERSPELLGGMATVALYTALSIALAAGLAWLWMKAGKKPAVPGLLILFSLMFSNTGMIGIPMMQSLFSGDPRLGEAMAYTAVVELVSNIFIFTVGIMILQVGCGRTARADLRSLLSPGMVGVVLGLVLMLTGVELPGLVREFLSTVGGASTAIIMFIVGAQMGELGLAEALRDRQIYSFCLMKLVVIPACFCVVLRLLGSGVPALVSILLTAMPAPTCAALFSRQYGGDYRLTTRCVLVSTLLSAATIPVWMALIW